MGEHSRPETADERAERLLRVALSVAVRIRDEPADAAARELDGLDATEVRDLALIACGGIDISRKISELYEWCDVDRVPPRVPRRGPNGKTLAPCGTHQAYRRHKANNEDPDISCELAAQEHEARRYARGETRRPWPRTPKASQPAEAAPVTAGVAT